MRVGGGGIDFQATYALFVCTDTLECKLVKCEVHHLSLVGPCPRLRGTRSHIHTGWSADVLENQASSIWKTAMNRVMVAIG